MGSLLLFTASRLHGSLVSFTPAALHLLTYIKQSSSCTNMLTRLTQTVAGLVFLWCYVRKIWSEEGTFSVHLWLHTWQWRQVTETQNVCCELRTLMVPAWWFRQHWAFAHRTCTNVKFIIKLTKNKLKCGRTWTQSECETHENVLPFYATKIASHSQFPVCGLSVWPPQGLRDNAALEGMYSNCSRLLFLSIRGRLQHVNETAEDAASFSWLWQNKEAFQPEINPLIVSNISHIFPGIEYLMGVFLNSVSAFTISIDHVWRWRDVVRA